ncbi:hypothetical protein ACRB68_66260 [Actinomadura sp. RB68]|uniref:Uncharacterized protein n=1 Tax=Actinomadura macrotermitis TaxID=2585200 RepID=A0A7K0C4Y9_9ACTN|nr:hypothetical protein [Actinomadura macrotermitis]
MAPSEERFTLLVRLVWELRAVPATAILIFPYNAEPVLHIPCRGGRRDAVLAVQRCGAWRLCWRGAELGTARLDQVARKIAMDAAA